MELTYNSDISYNSPSLTYDGNVRIIVSGISNPIDFGNLILSSLSKEDSSNSTTFGVTTFDSVPSGYVVIYPGQNVSSASISMTILSHYPNASITIEQI